MTRDPIGLALNSMNRLAGSSWLDRLGIRRSVEWLAYSGTRTGFRTLSVAGKQFKRARNVLPRQRLPAKRPPDLFDLTLDDDQRMIVDTLAGFADDVIRPAAGDADEKGQLPESIRTQAMELGLTLYAVPAEFGGVAETRSPVTSALVAEELARGDLAIAAALLAPFSVAQSITRWGSAEQQSTYLPAFCDDEPPMATIALDEAQPLFDPAKPATTARRQGDGYVLTGEKTGVIMAASSDLFLVSARLDDGKPRLFLVPRGTEGLSYQDDPAMGLRAAQTARLRLKQVQVPSDALLGDDDFDFDAFLDYASILRCGLAVGTARAVQDYVIPYCNEREAFGEPISHRQSVAFMIANMAIETDSMRLMTWRAASRAEAGGPFSREARLARLLCNDKAMEIGTNGVQLLGGHGFVKEHPVERWYRDLRSIATQFGGAHA
ncbi:alkylation response protein AidB-like acyl-CoA dehydrogenase [Tamilnaduibacter salinus]|uniref:Alkylation response protein AidB-like acyl-CoA dehydrogenase n=1 Tax=Tamilnaduibacter salinus TaxID=1484056 RepID=A0A2A2I3S2_9GAMM|nr:acyl-CoA dehydrogenase family protein [Tamilnaduibacter salinus]PAV25693.1 butyryl-CoA dehydrogenase [Tamilnaduibacter salinus]PVY79230.1 alkylation response protein AidB-like acyl-CoA dehydrogenase [Tamilnaduibacter salinus]